MGSFLSKLSTTLPLSVDFGFNDSTTRCDVDLTYESHMELACLITAGAHQDIGDWDQGVEKLLSRALATQGLFLDDTLT